MRRLTRLLLVVLAVALVAVPAASATTVEECQAEIAALRADTATVTTFTNERDRTGLLGKLDNASLALDKGKYAGAIQKLNDYRSKVETLGSTGKLGADDAARLDAAAEDAIACIEAIGS